MLMGIPLGKSRWRWEDTNKVQLREIGSGDVRDGWNWLRVVISGGSSIRRI
jgi:hypothetical protein